MILKSNGTIPISVNKSAINYPFIFWSKGESQFNEGDKFTYNSQGENVSSIKISNPSN